MKSQEPVEIAEHDQRHQVVVESEALTIPEPATTVIDNSLSAPSLAAPGKQVAMTIAAPPTPELPKRGRAGRFLAKPFHETVRGRRHLARIAAAGTSSSASGSSGEATNHQKNEPTSPSSSSLRNQSRGTGDRSAGAANNTGTGTPRPRTGRSSTLATKMETLAEPIKRMWVCEGCFKYMFEGTALVRHLVSSTLFL